MYINLKHKEMVEDRGYGYIGSYKCGETTIDGKCDKKISYLRVKCSYCNKEYDIRLNGFKKGNECFNCCNKYENSFAYYIQVELCEPLNKYWDWEKNILNPYLISKGSSKKVWIKCTEIDYHESYEIACNNFKKGKRCPYCKGKKIRPKDSFAQWAINNIDKDFLEKYWDYNENKINPWNLAVKSNKYIWIKCQDKDYHGSYKTLVSDFIKGNRCPYCNPFASHKVHPNDSFGAKYPEYLEFWDYKRNKKSPYEVTPKSSKKYWFKCEECGEPFQRNLSNLSKVDNGCRCKTCSSSNGEYIINKFLLSNNIKFEPQKEFKDLIGVKGGLLSYDFYLTKYNLLIEFQGQQHERYNGLHKTKQDFLNQQEHDRRKFNYAIDNKIDILYLYYWEINELEQRLIEELRIEG